MNRKPLQLSQLKRRSLWKARQFLLAFGFLLGGFQIGIAQPTGCDCDTTATWDASFSKANVVFLGTCMDISPNAIKGGLNILFQVDSSWKRAIEHVATVHTNSPNQCGYAFKRGQRYLVFANKRHQTVETSVCEPNQLFEDNGPLTIKRLGLGFTPGREEMAGKLDLMLVGLGLLGLLFLAFVVLRKKIRRPKSIS